MTCKNCKFHSGCFKTENDYINLKQKLTQKISEKKIVFLKYGANHLGRDMGLYKCNLCSSTLRLDEPDHAYRGGWFNHED